ncbi:MAG: amino acid permease, partial [Gemmatimonadota bacterium]
VMLLLIFAYGGFEAALMPMAEAKDPRRDAPFALFMGLVVVTIIYAAVQFAVLVVLPDPGASQRPLAEAARVVMGSAGAVFMAAAALISVYGYLAGAMLNVPRLTFAMAERGDLPRFMAWVHPVFRTPGVSIVVFAALIAVLAVQGSLLQNLSLSAVSRLSTYGIVCLALPVLRWRDVSGAAPALLRLPFGPLLAGLGLIFSLALATRMTGREAMLLAIFAALATVHWLAVRHRPSQERGSS